MIKLIQDYLETIFPGMQFAQIQDSPDGLINCNIIDTGNTPFFGVDTSILNISIYVRESGFEDMINEMEVVNNTLINIYDTFIDEYHIVNTKKLMTTDPSRDDNNRYYQTSTYEMVIEKINN